jgi:uncharacterized membrane protein YbhN (UPF0104 family)
MDFDKLMTIFLYLVFASALGCAAYGVYVNEWSLILGGAAIAVVAGMLPRPGSEDA